MTKVDERAVVPLVDAEARKRLTMALDRSPVVSALLFGSQATGRAGPLSDVDVAVWLSTLLRKPERDRRQLELTDLAARALGTAEVQLVILNDAPPLLRDRAVRHGIRLVDRDTVTRIRLETRALLEYLDTAPLRWALAEGVRHRIADDRFGRR